LVQVHTSRIEIATVDNKRMVLRKKTSIKYSTQPKLREVDFHLCCSGWLRAEGSRECRIPVCAIGCGNGGKCIAPDKCTCAPGFEGKYCQNDINECKDAEKNTCEQGCVNTRGSFKCFCKRGFTIDPKDASKCLDIMNAMQALASASLEIHNAVRYVPTHMAHTNVPVAKDTVFLQMGHVETMMSVLFGMVDVVRNVITLKVVMYAVAMIIST